MVRFYIFKHPVILTCILGWTYAYALNRNPFEYVSQKYEFKRAEVQCKLWHHCPISRSQSTIVSVPHNACQMACSFEMSMEAWPLNICCYRLIHWTPCVLYLLQRNSNPYFYEWVLIVIKPSFNLCFGNCSCLTFNKRIKFDHVKLSFSKREELNDYFVFSVKCFGHATSTSNQGSVIKHDNDKPHVITRVSIKYPAN